MQCPACARELLSKTVNELAVDVCEGGCGGVWFNWSQVTRWKGHPAPVREQLVVACDEGSVIDLSRRYRCPQCKDIVMSRDFSSVLPDLLLDECSSCGGFWLNGDEIDELPRHVPSSPDPDTPSPKASRPQQILQALHGLFSEASVAGAP